MATNVSFKAGEIIFQEGDEANAFYVVRSGKIRISRGDAILDDISTNAFFGEMSLIDDAPRSATATALEPCECVEIQFSDFHKRLHSLDPVMQGIYRVLVERLRRLDRRLAKQNIDNY